MSLHNLKPAPGSHKSKRRVGRGMSSGWGKTSGRGHKGQGARSGGTKGPLFEGGQMPIHMRLPKRGFNNAEFRKEYAPVNVSALSKFEAGATVTPAELFEAGLIRKRGSAVKVLGNGDISVALTVHAHGFSTSAIEKIEAAGGKAEVI